MEVWRASQIKVVLLMAGCGEGFVLTVLLGVEFSIQRAVVFWGIRSHSVAGSGIFNPKSCGLLRDSFSQCCWEWNFQSKELWSFLNGSRACTSTQHHTHTCTPQYCRPQATSIGWFSEAGLYKWMPFVIFHARSHERSLHHFRADFRVGVTSCCI